MSGIAYEAIPVPEGDSKYDLVSMPYAPHLQEMAVSLGNRALVREMKFA
jgi:hypothetical protein